MKRAAKVDRNQAEIVTVLRQMGASVLSLHRVGQGCPDLLVGYRGHTYLAEIKNGSLMGWRLTPAQREFHELWNAPIAILDSVETAAGWIKKLSMRKQAD